MTVTIESGPPQIRRDDVQRRVVIQSNVEGRDMGGLVTELHQRIADEIELPPGYSVVFGGQFENQQRAQQRLMIVVPLSLGLIFLLLYFAFHSIGQALLIMLNVPLAMIGGIAALGLIPMLLSHGVGSEVQRPLATVVVGGLASSTLLTLFVLPVLYNLFSRGVQRETR
ncbi:efflux RND transporter permease subunit [Thiolapillus sp.]